MLRSHMFHHVLHAEEPKNKSLIKIIKPEKKMDKMLRMVLVPIVPVLSQHPY